MHDAEAFFVESEQWIAEQLQGVIDPSYDCYWLERQMMGLIWFDYAEMESAEQGVLYFHWASEFEPRSWAWLL